MGTGKDSQCVEFQTPSGQTTAGCFEVSCNKDASKYKIIFQRDKALEINCSYETVGNQIQVGNNWPLRDKTERIRTNTAGKWTRTVHKKWRNRVDCRSGLPCTNVNKRIENKIIECE